MHSIVKRICYSVTITIVVVQFVFGKQMAYLPNVVSCSLVKPSFSPQYPMYSPEDLSISILNTEQVETGYSTDASNNGLQTALPRILRLS